MYIDCDTHYIETGVFPGEELVDQFPADSLRRRVALLWLTKLNAS